MMSKNPEPPQPKARLHIADYWCTDGGWRDYGSLPFEDALAKVKELMLAGQDGGCRCKRGWMLKPCPSAKHDCSDFNHDKFAYEDIYAD